MAQATTDQPLMCRLAREFSNELEAKNTAAMKPPAMLITA